MPAPRRPRVNASSLEQAELASNAKRAQRLARQISDRIFEDGLEAGDRLGSEADLMQQYQVSRTVFREAARILEHDGVARMKRGPSGGLIIDAVDTDAVTQVVGLWLRHHHAGIDELFTAREVVESRCAALAAENIGDDGIGRLREILEQESALAQQRDYAHYVAQSLDFHRTVANLSGNRVLELLVATLCDLSPVYRSTPNYPRQQLQDELEGHQAIAESIIAGDGPVASRRMLTYLDLNREFANTTERKSRERSVISKP